MAGKEKVYLLQEFLSKWSDDDIFYMDQEVLQSKIYAELERNHMKFFKNDSNTFVEARADILDCSQRLAIILKNFQDFVPREPSFWKNESEFVCLAGKAKFYAEDVTNEPIVSLFVKINQEYKVKFRREIMYALKSGRLYVKCHKVMQDKNDANRKEIGSVVKVFAKSGDLVRFLEKGRTHESVFENDLENVFDLSRFDSSHPQRVDSVTGAKQDNAHQNFLESSFKERLGEEEYDLMQTYYTEKAPAPHYHYYGREVALARCGSSYSLGINIFDLNRYLADLSVSFDETQKRIEEEKMAGVLIDDEAKQKLLPDILKYSIGMEYLPIIKNDSERFGVKDAKHFLANVKRVLAGYSSQKDKSQIVAQIEDEIAKCNDLICKIDEDSDVWQSGGGK